MPKDKTGSVMVVGVGVAGMQAAGTMSILWKEPAQSAG
jgi:heterodisulfide reductase subunit A-like polyferredoxin